MWWFTSDEHYGHSEMLQYRRHSSIEEMDRALIENHNSVVKSENDTVVHVGDFTLSKDLDYVDHIIQQLNGNHVWIMGFIHKINWFWAKG